MRRKTGGLILLGISSLLFAIYTVLFGHHRLNEFVYSAADLDFIVADKTKVASFPIEIEFNEQKLIFSSDTGTFYYSLVEEDDDAFNPVVQMSGDSKYQLGIYDSTITNEVISNNEVIEFIVFSDSEYAKYQLKCTTLPVMNIQCDEVIGDNDCNMQVSLFDNRKDCFNRVTSSEGEIRVRGATTRVFPKKSYKMTLTKRSPGKNRRANVISLLGMIQEDDWILYAAYNDCEKVRNVFSQNLWKSSCSTDNRWKLDTGNEYRYVEVFLNGEYLGLYALGYPISETQLRLGNTGFSDVLYKKIEWADEMYLPADPHEPIDDYEIKYISFLDKEDVSYDAVGWSILWEYYQNLYQNRTDTYQLLQYYDLDNAIDMYLFLNLIQGSDNASDSSGLYKNAYLGIRDNGGQKVSFWIPWDMDISWGNSWCDEEELNFTKTYGADSSDNCLFETGYLNQCMVNNDPYVWAELVERYEQLRQSDWSWEIIEQTLDCYEEDIFDSGAYLREMERWPGGSYIDPSQKLSVFKQYVYDRLIENDAYMESIRQNLGQNVFVKRTLQYPDFMDSILVIELNNKALLADETYVDFLEFLGVDVSRITENVHCIVGNQTEGYDYLDAFGEEGNQVGTSVGLLNSYRDEEKSYEFDHQYSIFLNEVLLFDTYRGENADVRMAIVYDGKSRLFNFTKDYMIKTY